MVVGERSEKIKHQQNNEETIELLSLRLRRLKKFEQTISGKDPEMKTTIEHLRHDTERRLQSLRQQS